MQTREIGKSGVHCSAIGLGTWAIGGAMWGGSDDAASRSAIAASLDQGITLVDTAPGYGLGHAETLVGQVIRGRRDKVVIATKCGLNWHSGKGDFFFEQYGKKVHRYLGADGIVHELDESLKRLGTDYVDIYITHWQDRTTPIEETMESLRRLKDSGKIRAIGASNLNPAELQRYIATGGLDCIQERYSMVDRAIETTLLPMTRPEAISTLSYSPMGMGLLTGAISPEKVFEGDDIRKSDPRFSVANRLAVRQFEAALADILRAHDIGLSELVVAWTLQQAQIDVVLCGARNARHALTNARAASVRLAPDEMVRIDDLAKVHLAALFS